MLLGKMAVLELVSSYITLLLIKLFFFQASSEFFSSSLPAELAAIITTISIYQKLKIIDVTLLSDNQELVNLLQVQDNNSQPHHWSLNPLLPKLIFHAGTQALNIKWISRQVNKIAEFLAMKARGKIGQSQNQIVCQDISHLHSHSNCPTKDALESSPLMENV